MTLTEYKVEFEFMRETKKYYYFENEDADYPDMFPHKLYLSKDLFDDEPKKIEISFKEI